MHEKPKRGQPLYQETGDWTLAPPTLQFLNFIDQADNNYADYRDMNVYGLDDTFSWFIPGARRQPRPEVRHRSTNSVSTTAKTSASSTDASSSRPTGRSTRPIRPPTRSG